MKKYLNKINNVYRNNLNRGLLTKFDDKDMKDYIFMSFKSLEVIPNIRILKYEWDPEEYLYDLNNHTIRRNKYKNKFIKNIQDSRCGVMRIFIEVSGLDKDGKLQVIQLIKPIIVPLMDEFGYFHIKGKKCYIIYQMVDKLLYPSLAGVHIKSLMPISVYINRMKDIPAHTDELFDLPAFTIQIFVDRISVILIYSHMGNIDKILSFLEVDRFIKVVHIDNIDKSRTDVLYFSNPKKTDCVVMTKREAFDSNIYIRGIVGSLMYLFQETKFEFSNINDPEHWMFLSGNKQSARRGHYQHIFYKRLLDIIAKEEMKIELYDKQDIYHLLRWILQNYYTMWAKDNLSTDNKRLRSAEQLVTFLTSDLSWRVNRFNSMGDRAGIKDALNAVKVPEEIFLNKMYSSGILRYLEVNSDLDFQCKTKFTKKGTVIYIFILKFT